MLSVHFLIIFMESILQKLENILWGAPLLFLLLGVGVYLTFKLKGVQFRYLFYSLKLAFSRQDDTAEGDISHFQALMTALAATIGIGSIAGVATAIVLGGIGALFWMWVAALLGMATKYGEAILAIKYRVVDEKKEMCGGPMYYLSRGMKAPKLAFAFALFGAITAFGIGNMVQANSVSQALWETGHLPLWITGVLLAIFTGIALLGGIQSIGKISSFLVPVMALLYMGGGIAVIFKHYHLLPSVFWQIVSSAFTGQSAVGGFVGSSFFMALQLGVSRGVFSSEAGLGSAPIAAAAAKTDVPARQALISMSGVFLTSFVVCSITGVAIAVTQVLGEVDAQGNLWNGSVLVLKAFEKTIPHGALIVTVSLILFAYSTILGWAYYGEKCVEYLGGIKSVYWYRILFACALIPGATVSFDVIWSWTNIMNALMAFPNLIALYRLADIIAMETKSFEKLLKRERKSL